LLVFITAEITLIQIAFVIIWYLILFYPLLRGVFLLDARGKGIDVKG
jgi:hypothetical protein